MNDPLLGYQFVVNLDPAHPYISSGQADQFPRLAEAGFQEVSGLGAQLEITTYAEGGLNSYVHQLPLRHTWNRIVLKRGITSDLGVWQWYLAGLSQSLGARRDGSITLRNADGDDAMAWYFRGGLAAKWEGPSLSASQASVAIETLEIAHNGIEQVRLQGADA